MQFIITLDSTNRTTTTNNNNSASCTTTNASQNGFWSKPYPSIDRPGLLDVHDRPFSLYGHQSTL